MHFVHIDFKTEKISNLENFKRSILTARYDHRYTKILLMSIEHMTKKLSSMPSNGDEDRSIDPMDDVSVTDVPGVPPIPIEQQQDILFYQLPVVSTRKIN